MKVGIVVVEQIFLPVEVMPFLIGTEFLWFFVVCPMPTLFLSCMPYLRVFFHCGLHTKVMDTHAGSKRQIIHS